MNGPALLVESLLHIDACAMLCEYARLSDGPRIGGDDIEPGRGIGTAIELERCLKVA